MSDLLDALSASQALRVAPAGEVFWYTSGTLGPYYINTENLFGGPEAARDLLQYIDTDSGSVSFHDGMVERIQRQLDSNAAFSQVIDALVETLRSRSGFDTVNCISGGERRDWFFSLPVAMRTGLPHLYIYKDHSLRWAENGSVRDIDDLGGKITAHCADLVTEASSYARDWVPAIRDRGGQMLMSVNVVDRGQGGMDVIRAENVDAAALLRVDDDLFERMRERAMIDGQQHELLTRYRKDPTAAMRQFLQEHPTFLQNALAGSDERVAKRAQLLVDSDPYGLSA